MSTLIILEENDLSAEKRAACFVFAQILAKNFVFIFLQRLIFRLRCLLPKNAAVHPCMLFSGGDTTLTAVCGALLKLCNFPQAPKKPNVSPHFLLLILHSFSLSADWRPSADIERLERNFQ